MPEKPAASVRRARVATWSQVVARVMTSNSMLSSPYGAAGVRDAPLPAALPLSARHARRAVRDIIEGERHRDAGVMPHQRDDIGDTDVPERLDGAVVEPARHPARVG